MSDGHEALPRGLDQHGEGSHDLTRRSVDSGAFSVFFCLGQERQIWGRTGILVCNQRHVKNWTRQIAELCGLLVLFIPISLWLPAIP